MTGVDPIRRELKSALARLPEGSIVFTKEQVDLIADALGGKVALAELLYPDLPEIGRTS